MDYTVKAPLVLAKNTEGGDVYVYRGAPVPAGQTKDWLDRHLAADMIQAVGEPTDASQTGTSTKRTRRAKSAGDDSGSAGSSGGPAAPPSTDSDGTPATGEAGSASGSSTGGAGSGSA